MLFSLYTLSLNFWRPPYAQICWMKTSLSLHVIFHKLFKVSLYIQHIQDCKKKKSGFFFEKLYFIWIFIKECIVLNNDFCVTSPRTWLRGAGQMNGCLLGRSVAVPWPHLLRTLPLLHFSVWKIDLNIVSQQSDRWKGSWREVSCQCQGHVLLGQEFQVRRKCLESPKDQVVGLGFSFVLWYIYIYFFLALNCMWILNTSIKRLWLLKEALSSSESLSELGWVRACKCWQLKSLVGKSANSSYSCICQLL